jgi:diguanylate cyclase (GGDEF)-like protein/PAS domain S-box-containing protein
MAVQVTQSALDDLVRRALEATHASCGWISLFEGERERLQARSGVAYLELTRERSFALASRARRQPVFVEDAFAGEWRSHLLVSGPPRARFFAVVPLVSREGMLLGALTVLDPAPRRVSPQERTALLNLGSLAAARLDAERGPAPSHPAQPSDRFTEEARRRRAAETSLEQERALAAAVIENLSGAFFLVRADGRMLRWNALLTDAVGYDDATIAGMNPLDFVSERDREGVGEAMRAVLERGGDMSIEAEIVDRDGNVRPYALNGRAVDLGGERCMLGMARDITMRRRTEQQMVRAKERLDLALASSSLALWDWDLAQDRMYFNENWASMLGDAPREVTFPGDEVRAWIHPDERRVFNAAIGNAAKGVSESFDCEYRVRNAAEEWIWVHSRGKVTQRDAEGRALRMTGTSTNITKRKQAEERAEYLATRDALTGLPNRVLLHDRLEQAVVNAARQGTALAFMFVDLDRFKTINDSLGHHAGDQLLKGVAARLQSCVRASDTVARLGGDEFAVLLENLREGEEGAQQVAEKMVDAMGSPMMIEGQPLSTSCSVGISLFPGDGRDSATLMKNADVAMYHAKEKGRDNYQFFSAQMNQKAEERLAVESYLRLALKRSELTLHYQPRMRVDTGELVGVEALIRWQHPRRGLLPPEKFIDVAEDSGLIVPIGEWVLETACEQLGAWQRALLPSLRMSVNLAVRQMRDGERLFEIVSRALNEAKVDPTTLELELTESKLMQDIEEKAALLKRLGALGVHMSIDDFGTGYSSLAYLKALPVDSIKIDSSFVRDIHSDPDDEAIIRAIIAMAHSLGLSVVAEGVETQAQLATLRELGCDEYQGHFAAPALTAAAFEAWLAERA